MNIITDHLWGRRKENSQDEDIFANGRVVLHDQLQVKGNLHRGLNQNQFSSMSPVALISQANDDGNTIYTLAIASHRIPLIPSMGLKPTLPNFLEQDKHFQELAANVAAETLSAAVSQSADALESETANNTGNNKPPVVREGRVLRRNSSFSFLQSLSRSRSSTPTPRNNNNNNNNSNHSSRHTSPSPQARTSRSGSFSFAFANAFSLTSSFDNNNNSNNHTVNNNSLSITDTDLLLLSPPPSSSSDTTTLPAHFSLTVTAKDHRFITLQTSELSVWQRWHAALREALADLLFGRVFQMLPTQSTTSTTVSNSNIGDESDPNVELSMKRLEIGLRRGPLLLPPAHCHLLRVKRLRNLKMDLNEAYERLMVNKLALSQEEVDQLVKRAEIDRLLMVDHIYVTLKSWVKDTGSGLLSEKELLLLKTHENIPLNQISTNENDNVDNIRPCLSEENTVSQPTDNSSVMHSPKMLIDRHSLHSIQSPLIAVTNVSMSDNSKQRRAVETVISETVDSDKRTNTNNTEDDTEDSDALFLASISSPRTTERIFARHLFSDTERLVAIDDTETHHNSDANITYSDSSKSSCRSVTSLNNSAPASVEKDSLQTDEGTLETELIAKALFFAENETADEVDSTVESVANSGIIDEADCQQEIINIEVADKSVKEQDKDEKKEEFKDLSVDTDDKTEETNAIVDPVEPVLLLPQMSVSPEKEPFQKKSPNKDKDNTLAVDDIKSETVSLIDNTVHKQYQRCLLQLTRIFKSPLKLKPIRTAIVEKVQDTLAIYTQEKVQEVALSPTVKTTEYILNEVTADNLEIAPNGEDAVHDNVSDENSNHNNIDIVDKEITDNHITDNVCQVASVSSSPVNQDTSGVSMNSAQDQHKSFASSDHSETALSDCQFQYYYVTPPSTSIDLSLISPIGAVTTPIVDIHCNSRDIYAKNQETQVTPSLLQRSAIVQSTETSTNVDKKKEQDRCSVILENEDSENNETDIVAVVDTVHKEEDIEEENPDINKVEIETASDNMVVNVEKIDGEDELIFSDINERLSPSIKSIKSPKYRYDSDNIAEDAEEESHRHMIDHVLISQIEPSSPVLAENNSVSERSPSTGSFIFHVSPCSTTVFSTENYHQNSHEEAIDTTRNKVETALPTTVSPNDDQRTNNEDGLAILAAVSSGFMSPPQKQVDSNDTTEPGVTVVVTDTHANISPLTPDSVLTEKNNNNCNTHESTHVHEDCSTSTDDLPGYLLSKKMQFQPAELEQIDEVLELLDELSQSASISLSQRTRHTHHRSSSVPTNNISFISSEDNTCTFPVPLVYTYPTPMANGMYSSTGSVSSVSMMSTGSQSHNHSFNGHYYTNHPMPLPHSLPCYTQPAVHSVPYYVQTYPYPPSPEMYIPPPPMSGIHPGHMLDTSELQKHDTSDVQSLNYSQSIILESQNQNVFPTAADSSNNNSLLFHNHHDSNNISRSNIMESPPKMPWESSFYASPIHTPIHTSHKQTDGEDNDKDTDDTLDVSDIFDRLSFQNNVSKICVAVGSPVKNTPSTTTLSPLRATVSSLSPLKPQSPKMKQTKAIATDIEQKEDNDASENDQLVSNVSDVSDQDTHSKHDTSRPTSVKKTKRSQQSTRKRLLQKLASSSLDDDCDTSKTQGFVSPDKTVSRTSLSPPVASPNRGVISSSVSEDRSGSCSPVGHTLAEKLKSRTLRQELSSTKQRVNELTDRIHRMRSKLLSQDELFDGVCSGNTSANVSFSCVSPVLTKEMKRSEKDDTVSEVTLTRTLDFERVAIDEIVRDTAEDTLPIDAANSKTPTEIDVKEETVVPIETVVDLTVSDINSNNSNIRETQKLRTFGISWKLCTSVVVVMAAIWLFLTHPLSQHDMHHNTLKLTAGNSEYGAPGRFSALQSKPFHFDYISSTANNSEVCLSVSRSNLSNKDESDNHIVRYKSTAAFNNMSKELSIPSLPQSSSEKKPGDFMLMRQMIVKSKALQAYQKWIRQIRPLVVLKTTGEKLKHGIFNLWREVVVRVTLMPKEHQRLLFESN